MKKSMLFKVMLLLTVSIFMVVSYGESPSSSNQSSYLFVQSAGEGILIPEKQPNTYELILKNVHHSVSYFTDRPERTTGLMNTEKFLQLWNNRGTNNFLQDAPNVGINGTKVHWFLNQKDVSMVMELSHPVYNQDKQTVTYNAILLPTTNQKIFHKKITLDHITLFFDNLMFCPSCCVDC